MYMFADLVNKLTLRWSSPPAPVSAAIPAGSERRLVWQLRNYWDKKRGDRPFASLADIDGAEIPEIWEWSFILDNREAYRFPYFKYLGAELGKYSKIYLTGVGGGETTLLQKAVEGMNRVIATREVMAVEDEVRQFDGRTLQFRAILLPLSDDQVNINFILGAANGRIVE